MPRQQFEFELYRINLVQEPPILFTEYIRPLESDEAIVRVINHAQSPEFKAVYPSRRNTFEWAVREFIEYHHNRRQSGLVYGITIAKSVTESIGEVVTDTGIEEDVSAPDPPLAATGRIFFYMRRHLVMVERNSQITNTNRWREALEKILKDSARSLEFTGWIELEPVPSHEEIFEAFRTFEVLTRLRVILRLPNPDLSEHSRDLYNRMTESRIREYLQDMKNPSGLNKEDGKLPHATVEMASLGYKKDEVTLEGLRDSRFETVTTGGIAACGTISASKEQVRAVKEAPETPESKQVITAILEEVDRIIQPLQEDDSE